LPVYKRSGGGGVNAVHDCQRHAFDQCVFVTVLRTRSTSMEWTDHPWSHWSDHPTCSTNALTAATAIRPLHMLLQAGVPDPAATGMAAPSSLSRRLF